jgi:hypothetical protein
LLKKKGNDKRTKPDTAVSNAGSLNISIYGLNRYQKTNERFSEQEIEELRALSMFCSELRYDVNEPVEGESSGDYSMED